MLYATTRFRDYAVLPGHPPRGAFATSTLRIAAWRALFAVVVLGAVSYGFFERGERLVLLPVFAALGAGPQACVERWGLGRSPRALLGCGLVGLGVALLVGVLALCNTLVFWGTHYGLGVEYGWHLLQTLSADVVERAGWWFYGSWLVPLVLPFALPLFVAMVARWISNGLPQQLLVVLASLGLLVEVDLFLEHYREPLYEWLVAGLALPLIYAGVDRLEERWCERRDRRERGLTPDRRPA
ncbi:MAG: hypothetical protein R3F62_20290 [Planctomycetota bacterium]